MTQRLRASRCTASLLVLASILCTCCWRVTFAFPLRCRVARQIVPRRTHWSRGPLRAGFSLHTAVDLDLAVPDDWVVGALPLVLVAGAIATAAYSLKASIAGPPVYRLEPGSMQGRTVVITGGSAGIGYEAAVRLADAGATVVATARTQEKAAYTQEMLRGEARSTNVHVLVLDLADLLSVRAFVEELKMQPWSRRIDVLINNAGVMAVPERRNTVDGFELQMAVNHLGHFALTGLILPMLGGADGQARVISVTSLAHRLGDGEKVIRALSTSEVWATSANYSPWETYSLSKLANVMFASELDRRFRAAGKRASAVSLHPGLCATELARYVVSGQDKSMEDIYNAYPPPVRGLMQGLKGLLRPVSCGANNHVFLAAGADGGYCCSGGEYFEDMRPAEAHPDASSVGLGGLLFEDSERLTGVSFDIDSLGRGVADALTTKASNSDSTSDTRIDDEVGFAERVGK